MPLYIANIPSPRLPYDVLRLIAKQKVLPGDWEQPGDTARALSRTCRDLRDTGQGLLWQTLTLPHRTVVERKDEAAMRRLLRMVRTLRWDKKEWIWDDGGDLARYQERLKDSADVFLELVGELATFTGVEIVCFPALRPPSLFSALSSSPSCRRLSYLTLLDEAFSRDAPHPRTEVELVSFLATLPALSTFHFNPICLVPPSSPSLDFTHTLSITSFSSDRGHHDVPAPIFLPGVPRHILSSAINPTTLREFTFRLDYEAPDGWMHWISSPGFTALRTLTITILPPFCTSDMFPLLSSILLHPPLLSELNLQDREDFGRIYEKDDPALSTFFTTLPPALELIRFRFRCPHENALQSYLAYERSSKLRFFECRTRNSGEIFRLEWNAPLQKFDTCWRDEYSSEHEWACKEDSAAPLRHLL